MFTSLPTELIPNINCFWLLLVSVLNYARECLARRMGRQGRGRRCFGMEAFTEPSRSPFSFRGCSRITVCCSGLRLSDVRVRFLTVHEGSTTVAPLSTIVACKYIMSMVRSVPLQAQLGRRAPHCQCQACHLIDSALASGVRSY